MEKRHITLGSYDTAATGGWTLTEWTLSPATHDTNRVRIPGRDGSLELAAALTDGAPTYDSRTLTIRLESSEGTRLEREATINTMTNWLDGWTVDIVLPDDESHYITGRVSVAREYNDPAHAAVTVTAICDPWRYNTAETTVHLTATEEEQTAQIFNQGRRTAVPLIEITGEEGSTTLLAFGTASWALSPGIYKLPDIVLTQGSHALTYSGAGAITLTYREAVL